MEAAIPALMPAFDPFLPLGVSASDRWQTRSCLLTPMAWSQRRLAFVPSIEIVQPFGYRPWVSRTGRRHRAVMGIAGATPIRCSDCRIIEFHLSFTSVLMRNKLPQN